MATPCDVRPTVAAAPLWHNRRNSLVAAHGVMRQSKRRCQHAKVVANRRGRLRALCAVLSSPAAAHHSFAAVFQMDTVTEIEGRVTGSLGQSAHQDLGRRHRWAELGSRSGARELAVAHGHREKHDRRRHDDPRARQSGPAQGPDAVGIEHPVAERNRAPRSAGRATALELDRGSETRRRSSSRAPQVPDGSERSFFRTWSPSISAFPRPRGAPVLTDEGRRAQARYESGSKPSATARCRACRTR